MNARRLGALGAAALLLTPVITAGTLVGVVVLWDGTSQAACNPSGAAVAVDPATVPNGPIAGYAGEQLVNAAYVMRAAADLGLSVRDQTLGVMTAMGESGLRVLDYGDDVGPDSRGLFQQRDNGAWGSLADRMDPYISARSFFTALARVTDRDQLEPTIAAHRVQGNADPFYYRPFWGPAQQVVQALAGVPGATAPSPEAAAPDSGYQLGDVPAHTVTVANTLGQRFGIATVGGYRSGDTDPVGHTAGLALDFMIDDIPHGADTGTALARYIKTHADQIGVAYVIWQQRIWSVQRADEGWRVMSDRGNPTDNHMDHVHLSLTGEVGSMPVDGCSAGSDLSADQVDRLMPAGRANPRTASEAIAWARNQLGATVLPDGTIQSGHCLRYVTLAYGYTAGYLYAHMVWTNAPASIRHPGDFNAPPGAVVVWSNAGGLGGGAGHIGISIGGGEMLTTSGTTVQIMPIRNNGYVPDANYYGWMPPVITA